MSYVQKSSFVQSCDLNLGNILKSSMFYHNICQIKINGMESSCCGAVRQTTCIHAAVPPRMARHPYKTNFRHIIITLRARLMELERVTILSCFVNDSSFLPLTVFIREFPIQLDQKGGNLFEIDRIMSGPSKSFQ